MRKKPLVSIVIPVYNDEDTIEVCLRTLIRQTYPEKEIIVVDDGSTDNTPSIISEMAKQYPSLVRVVSISHGGITKARNAGIKHATGEIIFLGEGDAIYNNNYLAKAVRLMMSNPNLGGVCLTGLVWVVKSTFASECIDVEKRIHLKSLETEKIKPFYAWVYRKKVIESVGMFDENLFQAEDKDLFLRVKKAGYSVGLIKGVNWRHVRKQDTKDFLKRTYEGGKTRIRFLLKHRKISELFKRVGLFWFFILTLPLIFVFPFFFYVAFSSALLVIAYKWFTTVRNGWNCVRKKRYLFAIVVFFILRYVATAIGYTHGLLREKKNLSRDSSMDNKNHRLYRVFDFSNT